MGRSGLPILVHDRLEREHGVLATDCTGSGTSQIVINLYLPVGDPFSLLTHINEPQMRLLNIEQPIVEFNPNLCGRTAKRPQVNICRFLTATWMSKILIGMDPSRKDCRLVAGR